MKKLIITFYVILCCWFSLMYFGTRLTIKCNITDLKISTFLFLVLLFGLFGYIRKWKYNDFSVLSILLIWGYNQYFEHWEPMFFGASQERIHSYYGYFKGTVRLFPAEPSRIIPNVWHMVIGALIVICIVLLLVNIFILMKCQFKKKLSA
jgi:hypothetical protein